MIGRVSYWNKAVLRPTVNIALMAFLASLLRRHHLDFFLFLLAGTDDEIDDVAIGEMRNEVNS